MEFISFDHKRLTRVTNEGNAYVLAFICHFSGYVVYAAVPDELALTTAKTFWKYIIGPFRSPRVILSDKGSRYMSTFLRIYLIYWAQLIKHLQQWPQEPMCMQSIKRLKEGLIRYSTPEIDDRDIEQILPIIQMSICLLYTSPSPRDRQKSRMPSSA